MSNSKIVEEIFLDKYGSEHSLYELKERIEDYLKRGYTKFSFEYETGYYGEVDETKLKILK